MSRDARVKALLGVVAASLAAGGLAVAASRSADGTPYTPPGHPGEFARPVVVKAVVSRPPWVGQSARLWVTIEPSTAAAYVVSVELPNVLAFVQRPAGFSVRRVRAADGTAIVRRAAARMPIGRTGRRLVFTLRAQRIGRGQIRVVARRPIEGGVEAGDDHVFLTVGRSRATSHFGFTVPPVGTTTQP